MTHGPVIHIVDDDESFRTAVSRLLRSAGHEVRLYPTAGDFLLADPGRRSGCVLLDIRMPGPSGLDLQTAILSQADPLPVIFLTGFGDVPTTVRALKAGAVDFLTKPIERESLLRAIHAALARDAEQRMIRIQLRGWRAGFNLLTPREVEVFNRVVAGKPNKAIAAELGTAERTVKAHRARVMQKMHVNSLAELVHVADQLNAAPRQSQPSA